MPTSPTVPALLEQLTAMIRAEYKAELAASFKTMLEADIASNGHKPATPRRKRQAARSPESRPSAQAVLAAIKRHRGPVRSEVLALEMPASCKVLRPVLAELVRARKVKRTGNRRSTAYEAR